jgi:hypothetical protein
MQSEATPRKEQQMADEEKVKGEQESPELSDDVLEDVSGGLDDVNNIYNNNKAAS